MISCTEFIPAYSELFKFLEKKGGKQAVIDFWNTLSDNYLGNLKSLVEQHGIRGCWLYWSRTLNEEAADFTMELDEDAGGLQCTMHHCPSKGRLLETKHITPYPDYCEHCKALYSRVLEPLGYEYSIDLSKCDQAQCSVRIKKGSSAEYVGKSWKNSPRRHRGTEQRSHESRARRAPRDSCDG